jgi:predicted phage baseplate assembly protein
MSGIAPTAFPAAGAGCCSSQTALPGVPAAISNAAGLSAIQYRIGDFTSFRAAMLAAMPGTDLLAGGATSLQSAVGPSDAAISVIDSGAFPASAPFQIKIDAEYLQVTNCLTPTDWAVTRGNPAASHDLDAFVMLVPPNPFASWHEGIDADYQTMFVELWAYLADILTFYQERIANEAFLGTASLRDSLLRLAGLVDYRPSPGAAAGGWVGFTAAANQSLTIPAGFRVASRPQPGQQSVVFETTAPISAAGGNNSIALSLLSPNVPFAPGTVALQGINLGVAVGDYLVMVDNVSAELETANLVQVTGVSPDTTSGVTTISWQDPLNIYLQATKGAAVYAFRVKAAPFGYNAPLWDVLSPTLTNSNQPATSAVSPPPPSTVTASNPQLPAVLYPITWELRTLPLQPSQPAPLPAGGIAAPELRLNDWFFIPVPLTPGPGWEPTNQLFLDRVYSQLKYSNSNQGLAVLLTDDSVFQVLTVVDSRDAAKTAYSLAAQSTRLTFDQDIFTRTFPLRNTVVLTGSELLPLQVDLPIPDPLTGASLTLAGIHTQLQDGQTVVLQGKLFDAASNSASSTVAAEAAILDGAPQPDQVNGVTVVNLKQGLTNQYSISSCVLLANVASVTQGQTVNDEILGSGDSTSFQSYPLKKIPLTYLPSTDPEGLSAVESTLTVSVNGVAWSEQPNLATSAPSDPVFVTTLDDSGQTTVVFGDGFNGARPPSGVDNIHAHYRNGLGSAGNLPSGAVQQLVDSLTNLQKVANPIPTSGGADQESPGSIRKSAAGSLQTFGRAVSAADYAALASSYPGIAKASAAWIVQDPSTQLVVAHPYVQLTAATTNRTPLQGTSLAANLRRFLDGRRDPNVLLRIQDFTPVYIAVTVEVAINAQYPHQATLNSVNAALNPGVNPDGSLGFFAFDRLQFGEPVFLSSLYAAVQAVAGVDNVVVTTLARVAPSPADAASAAPHDILIGPTEVAVVDGKASPASVLTVIGKGGFAGA